MMSRASAYAVLGLSPDAGRAEVDAAYRRLIKQFHPDRDGGDSARASEINRAYREIRCQAASAPAPGPQRSSKRRRRSARKRRSRWPWWLAAGLVASALVAFGNQLTAWVDSLDDRAGSGKARTEAIALDSAVASDLIEREVKQARQVYGAGGIAALRRASGTCHRRLRAEPSLDRLDRCAAFDDAAQVLIERDSSAGSGPFAPAAVTTRQMTAAAMLSSDYLAIEARMNRVRTMVDLALAPSEPAPAVERIN